MRMEVLVVVVGSEIAFRREGLRETVRVRTVIVDHEIGMHPLHLALHCIVKLLLPQPIVVVVVVVATRI